MYCSPVDARRLIEARHPLRKKIEAWWKSQGWYIPEQCFTFDAVAVAAKPAVATCRYEDIFFVEYAARLGLTPVWMEYTKSVLSSESSFKRSLLHPVFYVKHGKHDGMVTEKRKLGPIEINKTRPLDTIILDSGLSLVAYHHELHRSLNLPHETIIDLSKFYHQFDYVSRQYYIGFLSFFLAHAVLFDDYHGGEDAKAAECLTKEIFTPAYDELTNLFGISPLIVKMPWHEHLKFYAPPQKTGWNAHKVIPEQLFQLDALKECVIAA